MGWMGRLIDRMLGFDRVAVEELLAPRRPLFAHRDHVEKCPECGRRYLCRRRVCRIICARCDRKCEAGKRVPEKPEGV